MRISPKIPWSNELEMKLASLEYGPDALSTDSLLCQLVRAERLCQQYVFGPSVNPSLGTL